MGVTREDRRPLQREQLGLAQQMGAGWPSLPQDGHRSLRTPKEAWPVLDMLQAGADLCSLQGT